MFELTLVDDEIRKGQEKHYQLVAATEITAEDLGMYVVTELKRLANTILNQAYFRLERTHVAPTRPRGGDVRYADGTNWDPIGSGEGIYFFKESTSAWVKL